MPFWQLYYHIVTATKNREPLLTPEVEPEIHRLLCNKVYDLDGVVFAINGVEDHVHLVVAIPPKIAVARFIGQIKATSSTLYNKTYPKAQPFFWQEEYGVFSFDKKRVANCVAYVERQKEHHAQRDLIAPLELYESEENHRITESAAPYETQWIEW